MPLSDNGNVPSQPTGIYARICYRHPVCKKSVWCAAHRMYSPFPLSGFHQPPALCAGTETAVLLSGHRISCSIAYFSPAVKGFWREKTLFHDFRFFSDRDAPFFSKICKAVLAYPPIFLYNEEKHLFDFSKNFLGIVSTFSGFCASIRCSCKTQPLFRPNPKGAEIETFLSRQSVRRHV